ncbi:MAG TPA: cupin domain-containing protein [Patescibacteria group bacterium]|jgi:uncharacterized cupin superfamily protein|nr:cupin domain-containing protein [Patescibacteria group bacterium]
MNRPGNVVHLDRIDWIEQSHGKRYGWRRKRLAIEAGGSRLGCSLYELAPGQQSFPYHYHCANEEAIFVLDGKGTLRLPTGEVAIESGDYVALPPGEKSAHQVINGSNAPLRYLCMSTMIEPEISVYPETNKVGFFVGAAPGAPNEQRTMEGFVRLESRVDYWDGEE